MNRSIYGASDLWQVLVPEFMLTRLINVASHCGAYNLIYRLARVRLCVIERRVPDGNFVFFAQFDKGSTFELAPIVTNHYLGRAVG